MATATAHVPLTGARPAWAAATLGLGYAGVSVYWAFGGTVLLDTVGGQLAEVGRAGGARAVAVAGGAAAAKLVAAALPVLALRTRRRQVRILAWAAALVLLTYGALLTGTGLLVQAGVVTASVDADRHALAWHTFLWDPWFLVWGLLGTVALQRSRQQVRGPGRE